MTKKQKILELFNETSWDNGHDGRRTKIINRDDFEMKGLNGTVENHQQHCDVIYARKIIQGLGHRVIIGGSLFIWEKQ